LFVEAEVEGGGFGDVERSGVDVGAAVGDGEDEGGSGCGVVDEDEGTEGEGSVGGGEAVAVEGSPGGGEPAVEAWAIPGSEEGFLGAGQGRDEGVETRVEAGDGQAEGGEPGLDIGERVGDIREADVGAPEATASIGGEEKDEGDEGENAEPGHRGFAESARVMLDRVPHVGDNTPKPGENQDRLLDIESVKGFQWLPKNL
jgi:hypothetical protein